MKQINITFEDDEHALIEKIKEEHGGNWHDFMLDISRKYKADQK